MPCALNLVIQKKIPTSCVTVVFVIFFFLLYILGPSNLSRQHN